MLIHILVVYSFVRHTEKLLVNVRYKCTFIIIIIVNPLTIHGALSLQFNPSVLSLYNIKQKSFILTPTCDNFSILGNVVQENGIYFSKKIFGGRNKASHLLKDGCTLESTGTWCVSIGLSNRQFNMVDHNCIDQNW